MTADMTDWLLTGLEDDMRPRMAEFRAAGRAFALATITAADGGPRPVGAQMLVDGSGTYGFLSGGCIEADVALHGAAVLDDGTPRTLVYGHGSPFIDIRLPCGGRIEVLIERVMPDDPALAALLALTAARRPALWRTDGRIRHCAEALEPVRAPRARLYLPPLRLVVIGQDPFALAIADAGAQAGWATTLVSPFGPNLPPPLPVAYRRDGAAHALASIAPDRWTAVAIATHDLDLDEEGLIKALRSEAGYVGVMGSRRKLAERMVRLRAAGLDDWALARICAPIGLSIGAASPREVAVAVVAEIVDVFRDRDPPET